mgnify:CR=1 FL=1
MVVEFEGKERRIEKINQVLKENGIKDLEEAKNIALWHKNLFGDDYYLEIQNNGMPEQVMANQKLKCRQN